MFFSSSFGIVGGDADGVVSVFGDSDGGFAWLGSLFWFLALFHFLIKLCHFSEQMASDNILTIENFTLKEGISNRASRTISKGLLAKL